MSQVPKPTNWKDVAVKAFWTAVSAVAAVAITATTSLTQWWAPVLAVAVNSVLAFARQQLGEVPPDAASLH